MTDTINNQNPNEASPKKTVMDVFEESIPRLKCIVTNAKKILDAKNINIDLAKCDGTTSSTEISPSAPRSCEAIVTFQELQLNCSRENTAFDQLFQYLDVVCMDAISLPCMYKSLSSTLYAGECYHQSLLYTGVQAMGALQLSAANLKANWQNQVKIFKDAMSSDLTLEKFIKCQSDHPINALDETLKALISGSSFEINALLNLRAKTIKGFIEAIAEYVDKKGADNPALKNVCSTQHHVPELKVGEEYTPSNMHTLVDKLECMHGLETFIPSLFTTT